MAIFADDCFRRETEQIGDCAVGLRDAPRRVSHDNRVSKRVEGGLQERASLLGLSQQHSLPAQRLLKQRGALDVHSLIRAIEPDCFVFFHWSFTSVSRLAVRPSGLNVDLANALMV
jgi:hypothetical protein